eukprot:c21778_g1_i1.p1 GENE.c21778_g1_i1~~c21778_g1_i1.p1  ORF type:complete len:1157 (-),score=464.21 c21778_g1_i1:55-3087(-)
MLKLFREYKFRDHTKSWFIIIDILIYRLELMLSVQTYEYLPQSNSQSKKVPPTELAADISPFVVQLLIEAIVRSEIRDNGRWQRLREMIYLWCCQPAATERFAHIAILLTKKLFRTHYESAISASKKNIQESQVFQNLIETKNEDYNYISELTVDNIDYYWNFAVSFCEDCDENLIEVASINLISKCVDDMTQILFQFEDILDKDVSTLAIPDTLTALNLTGNALFRIVTCPNTGPQGVASSIRGLCSIFCGQTISSRKLPIEEKEMFISTLCRVLSPAETSDLGVVATVIENSTALPSLDAESSLSVVPYLTLHLDFFLKSAGPPTPDLAENWTKIRQKAITMLSSYLALSNASRDRKITCSNPVDNESLLNLLNSEEETPSNSTQELNRDSLNQKKPAKRIWNKFRIINTTKQTELELTSAYSSTQHSHDSNIELSGGCWLWIISNSLIKGLNVEVDTTNQCHLLWTLAACAFEDAHEQNISARILWVLHQKFLEERKFQFQSITVSLQVMRILLNSPSTVVAKSFSQTMIDSLVKLMTHFIQDMNSWRQLDIFLPFLCAAFDLIVDLIVSHQASVTPDLVGLFARIPDIVRDGPSFVAVELALRSCISKIINPVPPFAASTHSATKSSKNPIVYVGCESTNAIISISDIGSDDINNGVRIVVRDDTGKYHYFARPVWEDENQMKEREEGAKSEYKPVQGEYKACWDQTINSNLVSQCDNIQSQFIAEMNANDFKFCQDTESISAFLSQCEDTLSGNIDKEVEKNTKDNYFPPRVFPPSPKNPYDPNLSNTSRKHMVRLFLSTVGGLSPMVRADNLKFLQETPQFLEELESLDNEPKNHIIFNVEVHSQNEIISDDFIKFFQKIGDRSSHRTDVRVWVCGDTCLTFTKNFYCEKPSARIIWCEERPTKLELTTTLPTIFVQKLTPKSFLILSGTTNKKEMIGPLIDGMIVSDVSVGTLLPWTLMNTVSPPGSKHRYNIAQTRAERVQKIITECQRPDSEIALLSHILA